jgi:hypothetical protein
VEPVPIIKTSQERSKSPSSCSIENNLKFVTGQACGAKLGESKKLVLHNVDPIETETASYPWMTLIFALLSTCKSMSQQSFTICQAFNGQHLQASGSQQNHPKEVWDTIRRS